MTDQRSDKAPASCPFCGKGAPIVKITRSSELAEDWDDGNEDYFAVNCDASKDHGLPAGGCGAMGGFMPTENEAIANWNARTPRPPTEQKPAAWVENGILGAWKDGDAQDGYGRAWRYKKHDALTPLYAAPLSSSAFNKVLCPYCNPLLNQPNPAPNASEPMVPNGEYRELHLGGAAPRSTAAQKGDALYASHGYALAARVMQSDLYAQLDDRERAECDALVRGEATTAAPITEGATPRTNLFVKSPPITLPMITEFARQLERELASLSKDYGNLARESALELLARSAIPQIAPPTEEEISAYRDAFRTELDKRMLTTHPSASPSTESHAIALRRFVENRNKAGSERPESAAQWTPKEAKRLLAFQHAHCTDDHQEAYHEIYWLVADRAADQFHPWAEVEAQAKLLPGEPESAEKGKR